MKHILLSLLALSTLLCADTIQRAKNQYHGIFTGFYRTKIGFQEWKNDFASSYDPNHVDTMTLDQPVPAKFFTMRSGNKGIDGTFLGFKNAKFQVILDGQEQSLSPREIYRIDVTIDQKRFRERREDALRPQDGAAQAMDIRRLAVPGKATLIHFFQEKDEARAAALQALCDSAQGKAVYKTVPLPQGTQDPTARKCGFQAFPQIWIFNAYGALFKMDEAATEEQLRETFQNALKGAK